MASFAMIFPEQPATNEAIQIVLANLITVNREELTAVDDFSTIPKTDISLEALEMASKALKMGLEAKISEARRARNRLQRLHQLPVELFMDVLTRSLEDVEMWNYYEALERLRNVATYWREVIDANPHHFQCVLPRPPYSASEWDDILATDSNAPLHIWCPSRGILLKDSFLQKVAARSSRWKSLDLEFNYRTDLDDLHGCAAPNLESLSLSFYDANSSTTDENEEKEEHDAIEHPKYLFNRQYPKLRKLALTGMGLRPLVDLQALTHLTSLILDGVQFHSRILSLHAFIYVLSSNEDLDKLHIIDVTFNANVGPHSMLAGGVTLFRLKEFTMRGGLQSANQALVRALQLPALERLDIQLGDYQEAAAYQSLEHLGPQLNFILDQAVGSVLEVRSMNFVIKSKPSPRYHIAIDLKAISTPAALAWVHTTFAEPGAEGLLPFTALFWSFAPCDETTLLKYFPYFRRVRKVGFNGWARHDVDAFFRCLSVRRAEGWAFPEMTELHLGEDTIPSNTIFNMLSGRYGGGPRKPSEAPKPLELLRMAWGQDLMLRTVESIERVVGYGKMEILRNEPLNALPGSEFDRGDSSVV